MIKAEKLVIRPVFTRILSQSYDKWQDPLNVFLRTACVGNSLIPRIFRPTRLSATYAQKCHVDFLNHLSKELYTQSVSPPPLPVLGKNMKEWHKQNFSINFQRDFLEADFSLFDSFCELTDLKLEVAEDIWAYGHKKDFNLNPEKKYDFVEISVEDIEQLFHNILEKKMLTSPNKPLIYLFYSSINDSREKYKLRSQDLLEMGQRLSENYPCFKLLKLDSSDYHPSTTDSYPYHYSNATSDKLAVELALILGEAGIKASRYTIRI